MSRMGSGPMRVHVNIFVARCAGSLGSSEDFLAFLSEVLTIEYYDRMIWKFGIGMSAPVLLHVPRVSGG